MPLISEGDLERIWSWNAQLPETVSAHVQDLIAETARRRPFAPAVCAWDGDFNYEQLMLISSQIAEHIIDCGIQPGVVLPLCMQKSKWMPVTMLGALKADCGISLLDSNTSYERLCDIIQILDPPFVLTTLDLQPNFDKIVRSISVDKIQFEMKRPFPFSTTKKKYSSIVAAVVFTSGSTGSPKGVILSPECLSTTAVYGSELFELDRASRIFQFSSYSFDISLHETMMTLLAGGCLCIPSETERMNNAVSAIKAFDANWICITPSAAAPVLSDMAATSLETIVFTGEAITARVYKFLDTCKVFSWYGASEVPLTSVSILRKDTWKPSQIGSRSPGVCWIVKPEDSGVLCAIGEVGELLVEGPMQTKGYLNAAKKIEAAFVLNPIWLTQGSSRNAGRSGKLYKTGDLVKYNADGTLAFVSRKDTMVKIRGQRIELSGVEHKIRVLMRSNEICSDSDEKEIVVVAVVPGGSEDMILVCFILVCTNIKAETKDLAGPAGQHTFVATSDQTLSMVSTPDQAFEELRSALDQKLRQVLPDYMVPSIYLKLHSLPMTHSGKTDRRLLCNLAQQLSQETLIAHRVPVGRSYTEPNDKLEQQLHDLWARILQLDEASISTNMSFSQCGGDSLRAMTLARALEKNFFISVKVSQLISKETTIQYLATSIKDFRCGKLSYEPLADVAADLTRWITALRASCTVRHHRDISLHSQMRQILLTGATGYLGTQILSQLVSNPQVDKVFVLVRADNISHANERIRSVASNFGWWTKSASRRIEVWVGNLSEPRLGLDDEKWNLIPFVDTIIHNGAVVSWGVDGRALESVNVRSTFQILQACLQSSRLRRMIYVSGGIKKEQGQQNLEHIKNLNSADGYSQTKYISEQLTLAAGRLYHERTGIDIASQDQSSLAYQGMGFKVVKPGYIIGDHTTGLSNIDDFLWRVVAGAVRMQCYPQDPPESWLDLAEVTYVAKYIVRQCDLSAPDLPPAVASISSQGDHGDHKDGGTNYHQEASCISCPESTSRFTRQTCAPVLLDDLGRGLLVSRFWAAVRAQTNVFLEPKDWNSWIELAHKDMEHDTETHPLWGIQQFLGPRLGSSPPQPAKTSSSNTNLPQQRQQELTVGLEVEAAVRRSVQYLIDVKFISIPTSVNASLVMGRLSPSKRKRERDTRQQVDHDYNEVGEHEVQAKQRNPSHHDQHQHQHERIGRSKFTHY